MASWDVAITEKRFGLENRMQNSQINNDDLCSLFYPLISSMGEAQEGSHQGAALSSQL